MKEDPKSILSNMSHTTPGSERPAADTQSSYEKHSPAKKRKKYPRIEVIWEQESGPDASSRLLAAFEMLLTDAAIVEPDQQGAGTDFDKGPGKDNHASCKPTT